MGTSVVSWGFAVGTPFIRWELSMSHAELILGVRGCVMGDCRIGRHIPFME